LDLRQTSGIFTANCNFSNPSAFIVSPLEFSAFVNKPLSPINVATVTTTKISNTKNIVI
jgi:hypothetical protein